ncbi:hypothetical protein FQN50_003588 [Emmonsiellopsis sp. PD_5]|nr:hypothetical protein FQN50_003588 [Emmonsiellopsis sp. PD_5]
MKLNTICIAMLATLVTYTQALPRDQGEGALAEALVEAIEDQVMLDEQSFPELDEDAQQRCLPQCYIRRPRCRWPYPYGSVLGAGGAADGRSIDGTCEGCCSNLAQRY